MDALRKFNAAARKIEKAIDDLASGNGDEPAVWRAIERLDARTRLPEIRGNALVNDQTYAIVSDLRARAAAAAVRGAEKRRERRDAESLRLRQEEREYRRKLPF